MRGEFGGVCTRFRDYTFNRTSGEKRLFGTIIDGRWRGISDCGESRRSKPMIRRLSIRRMLLIFAGVRNAFTRSVRLVLKKLNREKSETRFQARSLTVFLFALIMEIRF
jgi:hypothetical protein